MARVASATVLLTALFASGTQHPPAAGPTDDAAPPRPSPSPAASPAGLPAAQTPVRVKVPSLKVNARIEPLGLNKDNTLQVPPFARGGNVGWYSLGAAPGTVGPAVLVGHKDLPGGADGVFARLDEIQHGATVAVTDRAGQVRNFSVTRIRTVGKGNFPTDKVYGPTRRPELRLITCGGAIRKGHWDSNVIADAIARPAPRAH
ncbi:sortase domain-bontaining protein [Streptomyces sp. NPDC102360]|uniref:sortase domain-containing protein n=1 Tax=Streptomyces sp. NPDC102360 TaxID=3366160 RepID=UPI00380EE91E